jgi:hypothetical protein
MRKIRMVMMGWRDYLTGPRTQQQVGQTKALLFL